MQQHVHFYLPGMLPKGFNNDRVTRPAVGFGLAPIMTTQDALKKGQKIIKQCHNGSNYSDLKGLCTHTLQY